MALTPSEEARLPPPTLGSPCLSGGAGVSRHALPLTQSLTLENTGQTREEGAISLTFPQSKKSGEKEPCPPRGGAGVKPRLSEPRSGQSPAGHGEALLLRAPAHGAPSSSQPSELPAARVGWPGKHWPASKAWARQEGPGCTGPVGSLGTHDLGGPLTVPVSDSTVLACRLALGLALSPGGGSPTWLLLRESSCCVARLLPWARVLLRVPVTEPQRRMCSCWFIRRPWRRSAGPGLTNAGE